MMAGERDDTTACHEFRELLYSFQADELEESEREACQRHLDRCAGCADRLQAEVGMWNVLRAKLPRIPAPPGLETRVRAALRSEFGPRSARVAWFRTPWFAATAAAVLLMAVLVPGLTGRARPPAAGARVHQVTQEVTVVDHDCDKAGRDPAAQRRCSHPLHVNALKLPGGDYWTISPGPLEFRHLLLDADSRGRRFEVRGDYYPGPETIVLRGVVPLDRDRL